ncbi:MAG: HD domain-containing protein [Patescibacteria group bacterium]
MITRERAISLLHKNMESQNLRRHCYAVEAVMRALARYFKEDEEKWGIVGLLHDGDYEKTKETPGKHTLLMVDWLKEAGERDSEILNAILTHNYAHLVDPEIGDRTVREPKTNLEWSLYCCDELTGLIVAVALVRPDKRISSVTVNHVMKKWKEKSFAAGVNRKQIEMCEEKLNIPLREFIGIALEAMQGISEDLGL